MRFLHLSDLHLGKSVNGFSMIEDQKYVLSQVISMAQEHEVDGILLAGDIYDRSIPSVDAVELFDEFLFQLEKLQITVYIVAGNHDSKERLSFGNRILKKKQIYIQGELERKIPYIEQEDEYGKVRIYLLPFFRLPEGKAMFDLERGTGYEDVIRCLLKETQVDTSIRNILVTHLFVTSSGNKVETCDSEMALSIGGVEQVSADFFEEFDYAALGHIHGPQKVGRNTTRYAGSLLKYSFSEEFHKKSAVFIELKEKGSVSIELLPFSPLRDMRRIKGKCQELMSEEIACLANTNDYVAVLLTDEEEMVEPAAMLRRVYPNLMQVRFMKNEQKYEKKIEEVKGKERSPLELFDTFLEEIRGEKDKKRSLYMKELLEEIEEEIK
ncbi:MAG: exonuclease SbcCD subunit D [Lachnospiraceae bacterium]|nr:exonuclease SbcCD subunit D [Lachnospiraceae bacterium]